MPFFSNTENDKLNLEKLIKEVERLNQETTNIFNQMGITEEEFENYIQDQKNFTPTELENLQNHQKAVEERLSMLQNQAVDAKKTAKKRSDMHLSQHWLPVR